jgi:hypothetical protein
MINKFPLTITLYYKLPVFARFCIKQQLPTVQLVMYMWGVGSVNNQSVHGATFLCCNKSLFCAYITSAIQVNVLLISSTHTKLTQAMMGQPDIHSHFPKRGICKLINTLPLQLFHICPKTLYYDRGVCSTSLLR